MLTSLLKHLDSLPAGSKILTIDGPAGAGKTTLAKQLSQSLESGGASVRVIHMDDLYNGWGGALTQSLTASLIKITDGWSSGRISYKLYDWEENNFTHVREFESPDFLILEGVGSGQSAIRERIACSIWIEMDPQLAIARVITRDGEKVRPFLEQWLIDQSEHFFQEKTASAADYAIDGAP